MRPNKPQRLTPPAKPGELFKRLQPTHQKLRIKQTTDRDPVYLSLIRSLPCLRCGMEPPPQNEAAHVRMQSAAHGKKGGMRKKPPDRWTLPLCMACHQGDNDSQHQIGEALFWHLVGINPLQLCEKLYEKRGDFLAMRMIVMTAIAERSMGTR